MSGKALRRGAVGQTAQQPIVSPASQTISNSVTRDQLCAKGKQEDVAQQAQALEARAIALLPQADAYLNLMDQIAGHNMGQVSGMADDAARSAHNKRFGQGFAFGGIPADWDRISLDERHRLMAIAQESTRQLRQDLRQGRSSALVNPEQLDLENSPDGVRSVMRVNQALQDNDMPQDFQGHSPHSAADVDALVGLGQGKMPTPGRHPAAIDSLLLSMKNRPNAQDALQQAMLTDTVPTGVRGMTDALPNAKGLHKELLALCREREQLATSAGASVAVPTLDAIVQRMQSLDDNVAKHGLALYERLGGQGSQTVAGVNEEGLAALKQMPKPPFQPCDVVDNRKAAKDNKGRPTGPALQQESTAPKWLVPQYPGTFATDDAKGLPTSRSRPGQMSDSFQNHSLGGLQQPLTPEQKNELVRVKDSMELLRGNETGLSMAHIPMSPGLREKIGIPGSLAHQPLPTYRPGMEHFDVEGHFTPEKRIDQAALQPAAHRGAYLRDINQKGFRASLQERSRTELTEEFDNTFMNRTAEALDVVGWAFKGRDKNNWIGPRSERNLERSHYIGKEVDSLTSEVSKNAIYGQHGMAMDQLREVHSLNDIHQGHNDRYEALHQQTQMETGMFLAMLPLSAMGAASSAQKLGQKAMRATSRTATRTAGKTASRATSTTSSRVAGRAATPAMRATQRTARAASPTASKAAQSAAGITDDIATLRKANQGQAASARSVQVDAKGFVSRPNPLEDEFVQRFRKQWPTMKINDDAIRAEFRAGKRFNADGSNLRTLTGDEAFLQRQQEVGELRHSPLFDQDLKARGISQERIKLMDQKKCPLSFDAPETYQEFQADLRQTLKKLELNDSAVTLKGTSTTFYSENPSKPLGHHFDANPLEIADIDLGVSSQKMVDAMKDAGKAAHPKISTIYKTRDTVEVFPELQAFAERWEARLGRPVNFVGLTSGKKPILDPADYLVSGSLK